MTTLMLTAAGTPNQASSGHGRYPLEATSTTHPKDPASGEIEAIQLGELRIVADSYAVWIGDRLISLTAGEFELLWLLACHAGQLVTQDQIARLRVPKDQTLSNRAVRARVSALRHKLGRCASQIRTVRGLGYVVEK